MKSSVEARMAIHNSRNCGWVHRAQCHGLGEGGKGQLRAIAYLIRYEGLSNILEFVREMSLLMVDVREQMHKLKNVEEMMRRSIHDTALERPNWY